MVLGYFHLDGLFVCADSTETPGDRAAWKKEIETLLREKLIFSAQVELVLPGTLLKYEYKAKLVEKTYE